MAWETPKINWKSTDKFNISDFNRIKNNINIVLDYLSSTSCSVDFSDMGADVTTYTPYWDINAFNAIEENVETICNNTEGVDAYKITFRENGAFITSSELNRIESLTNMYSDKINSWIAGLERIPMVVGRDRRLGF